MAKVNITVTPVRHLGGSAWQGITEDGTRYAPVQLSIASGQTYATADRAVLVHSAGSDFYEHFGSRVIKAVLAEPLACSGVSTGLLKIVFDKAVQNVRLRLIGQGGGGAPAGPRDEANLGDGTALGAGVMACNALIFW